MNNHISSDSSSQTGSHESGQEVSLFERLRARFDSYWHGPADVAALREAALELIDEASKEGENSTVEREFLSNIISLREKEVGDCMVPRAEIAAIDVDSPLSDLVNLMTLSAHSRIPAYRETLDETVGMLHMKDILPSLAKGKDCDLKDFLRPVLFVAPSMLVSKLLLQMRSTRQHMAMVIDEFGGVDGLVTIEDLVEEVVGEIKDEHDAPPTPDVIVCADGALIADGKMEIEKFEDHVGSMLSEEERETIDTLGGYVFHLAGHVPRIGETVKGADGVFFDVLETDQNRICRVRVRTLRKS